MKNTLTQKLSLQQITYQELVEKIESKEKFVLFIGKQDCSHCQKYKSTINKVVEEYDVEIAFLEGKVSKFIANSKNKKSKRWF